MNFFRSVTASKSFWIALFVIRLAGLSIGIDRLPMVPTVNPEVVINDPAVSLATGHGYVAYSFEHSVNGLDKLYAHFPPVFIALQALVFRLFGFSAVSLRALSAICDLLTCMAFLLVVREFYERKILDRTGAVIAGVLILLEPTAMIHAREARMESLGTFLGGLAFFLCVRNRRFGDWIGAGLIIGVALATHPAAALMWVAFEVWSLLHFRQLGFWRWIAINALPPLVMASAWLVLYGSHIGDAVAQMRHLATFAGVPDLRIIDLFESIRRGAIPSAQNAGGLGSLFTILAVPFVVWRVFAGGKSAPSVWRTAVISMLAVIAIQLLLLRLVIPTSGMNRAVMIFPFVLIGFGMAISYLSQAAEKRIVVVGLLAAAIQVGMVALYLGQLGRGWNDRSPDRFNAIVASVSPNARVAGPPELWYGFRHLGRPFTVIYRAMGEDEYWNTPGAFDSYDVVILDPNWPAYQEWRARAEQGRSAEKIVHTYARDFLVIAKSRQ